MEIGAAAMQPMPVGGTGQKNDASADIQKLEQQKQNIEQQLRKLEQGKQNKNDVKNAKDKLQKQMQEIDRQIQVLRQQGTSSVQPAEEGAKARSPRFDKYVKSNEEEAGAGIYSVEQDENGNPSIVFDSPIKDENEKHNVRQ